MDELSAILSSQRQVLESLLFRLLGARSLLSTGETRFLSWAASDVERAAARLREVEVRRWSHLQSITPEGAEPPRLRDLAESQPEPLRSLFEDHRRALGRLVAEVAAVMEATQEYASQAHAQLSASAPVGASARSGSHLGTRTVSSPRRPRDSGSDALDREIAAAGYEALIGASSRLTLPSLIRFLS
jgi:hypothetical protein